MLCAVPESISAIVSEAVGTGAALQQRMVAATSGIQPTIKSDSAAARYFVNISCFSRAVEASGLPFTVHETVTIAKLMMKKKKVVIAGGELEELYYVDLGALESIKKGVRL